jgi:hypothetical protein
MKNKKIIISIFVGVLLVSFVSAGWFSGNAVKVAKDAPWGSKYCTFSNPCDAGMGDCDKDSQCKTGYCAQNVGLKYNQSKKMDVCEYKMGENCNSLFSIVESSFQSSLGDANYDARADIELDGKIGTGDYSYFSPNSQDEEWCGNRLNLHCAKLLNLFNDAWDSSSGDSNFDTRIDIDNSGSIGTADWSYISPNVENESWCAAQISGSGNSNVGNVVENSAVTYQGVLEMLGNARVVYSGSNIHKLTSCTELCSASTCLFSIKRSDQYIYSDTARSTIQEFLIPCAEGINVGSYQEGQPVEHQLINEGTVETYALSCLCVGPA